MSLMCIELDLVFWGFCCVVLRMLRMFCMWCLYLWVMMYFWVSVLLFVLNCDVSFLKKVGLM